MATPDHYTFGALWEQAADDGNYDLAKDISVQAETLRHEEELLRTLGDYGFDYLRSHKPLAPPDTDHESQLPA